MRGFSFEGYQVVELNIIRTRDVVLYILWLIDMEGHIQFNWAIDSEPTGFAIANVQEETREERRSRLWRQSLRRGRRPEPTN